MNLFSLHEAVSLDVTQANDLFKKHIHPGLLKAYAILGTAKMDIESASGAEIKLRDGRVIVDFSSALGVLGLGHNHPRIIQAERLCHELKLIDAIKVAPQKLQAALAHNICQFLPEPLQVVFLTVSGAEAVEAAMKLCEKAQGKTKTKFITTTGAYHGKTHGALSLTRSGSLQDGFLLGVRPEDVVEVPYGDMTALEAAILGKSTGDRTNPFIAVVLEPIQGQGVLEAPPGYLKAAAEVCQSNRILVVFDEVKVGMGRTGSFCAFQQEDVVPDVVTLSKALGGGKRAIGAMITSGKLFERAYGKRKDWAAHTTTFGGLGESCAVAIETLNVLFEEGIIDAVREKGEYLRAGLIDLKKRHPDKISELRGRGLFQGIRFNFMEFGRALGKQMRNYVGFDIFRTLDSVFMAGLIRELYCRHNILVHFSSTDPDVLHIMPPLIIEKHHIDHFMDSLDQSLAKGFVRMAAGVMKS